MQLMSERGLEKTVTNGFGWIAGDVKEIAPADPALKIPQIGWNTIHVKHAHPLFAGIPTGDDGLHAYFVHSYHLDATGEDEVLAVADYGGPVTAAVAKRQSRRHAVPPRKEPGAGPGADRQFPEVEAVMKKGYWMAMVDVTDPENYPKYIAANKPPSTNTAPSSWCAAASDEIPTGRPATRHVIIEFDSYETALACFNSPEYQAALKLRRLYSTAHFAIVEGA